MDGPGDALRRDFGHGIRSAVQCVLLHCKPLRRWPTLCTAPLPQAFARSLTASIDLVHRLLRSHWSPTIFSQPDSTFSVFSEQRRTNEMSFVRTSALFSFVLVCAWNLIAIPSVRAQACPEDGSFSYSITGTGASTLGPFFTSLVFGYRDLSKETCPSYLTSSSGSGRSEIVSKKVPLLCCIH